MRFTWDGKTSVKIQYMPVSLAFFLSERKAFAVGWTESLSGDDPEEGGHCGDNINYFRT